MEEILQNVDDKSDAARILETFLDKKGISGKTVITSKQRKLFWILSIFHKSYPTLGYDALAAEFLHLSNSVGGLSRKQSIEIVKGLFSGGALPPAEPGNNGGGRRF